MMADIIKHFFLCAGLAAAFLTTAANAWELELKPNAKLAGKTLVFTVHRQYAKSHHNTDTMAQQGEITGRLWKNDAGESKLLLVKFDADGKPSKPTTIAEAPQGVVRDLNVSNDGRKIVYSMRNGENSSYKIYETNLETRQTKRLTNLADACDFDPVYLPTGEIVFASTRAAKYCGCNRHIMANLYRMNPDGTNILQIGNSIEFEHNPSVMRDGRILYTRWEYVDRNFGGAQGLWTCNPDGTSHALYWGQETSNPCLNAVQMPDSSKVVAILSTCHGRPNGSLAIIDRRAGIEGEKSVVKIYPKDARVLIGREKSITEKWGDSMWRTDMKYEDPCPVSEDLVLVSRYAQKGACEKTSRFALYLIDLKTDAEELIADVRDSDNEKAWDKYLNTDRKKNPRPQRPLEEFGIFSTKLVQKTPLPAVIADQRGDSDAKSFVYVSDVYEGTHMQQIKRGDIKYLRVVENAPKFAWSGYGWSSDGEQAPAMNYEDYAIKVDLGIVEVEDDGSAYFEIPADKFIYLQALDKDKNMIQTMRSGLVVLPGEICACTGCHESRYSPPPTLSKSSKALRAAPRKLIKSEISDKPFSYVDFVQPIFTQYCMDCHDKGGSSGINLSKDLGLVFNKSYLGLLDRKNVNAIGAGANAVQQANTWGAKHSVLMKNLKHEHSGARIPKEKIDVVRAWIDLNSPYYPTHDSAYTVNLAGRCPLTFAELEEIAKLSKHKGFPSKGWITSKSYRDELVSFTRPEMSDVLDTVKKGTPEYARILEIIKIGAKRLEERPRGDSLQNFKGLPIDDWRLLRFKKFQELEKLCRKNVDDGTKIADPEKLDIPPAPTN